MKRKSFLCMTTALMILFAWGACFAADPGGDEIIVKIEDEVITQKDVDKLIENLDPQMASMYRTPEGRAALTEELINSRLFSLKGIEEGVDKSPEYLDEIERFKKHALMKVTVDKMLEGVEATDEDARKFYTENSNQFAQPAQIRASHILVENDEEMKKVIAEIEGGKSFEDAAKEFSTCPSKERGGDLGFFGEGQMVPEFEKVAFATEVGKISEPVKTQFGVHIIKVEAKNPESMIPFEDVLDQLKAYLQNQKRSEAYQAELSRLKEKYKIVRTAPAPENGNP